MKNNGSLLFSLMAAATICVIALQPCSAQGPQQGAQKQPVVKHKKPPTTSFGHPLILNKSASKLNIGSSTSGAGSGK